MRWTLLAVLFAAGCYNESDFVPAKTTAFCSLLLECTDPAVLAFDGMDESTCQGVYGPVFRAEGEGCKKFKKGAAKDCVAALELASCPADGTTVLEAMPSICGEVFQKCTDVVDDPPEDTDPVEETGTAG